MSYFTITTASHARDFDSIKDYCLYTPEKTDNLHARMMRYQNLALIASLILLSLSTATAASDDISNIKKVISTSNDPKMRVQDLAFFLATHNYDVRPLDGYVELRLDGRVYRLTPNGDKQGLYDIVRINSLEG